MNTIYLSPELALGWAELKFLFDGLNQSRKDVIVAEMEQHGVIQKDADFTSFEVIQGAGASLSIRAGDAIDQYGNVISNGQQNNLFTLLDGDAQKAVILTYDETYIERYPCNVESDGTVSINSFIDVSGTTFGFDGDFISRCRGAAQFPTVIKFPNSTVNTGEYLVQSVISGTQLVLNVAEGVLQPEANAEWAVVGTFTPGVVIPEEDKFPFRRGYGKFELVDAAEYQLSVQQELDVNFPGVIFLAVISYNEGVLTIQDVRSLNKYAKSSYI